MTDKTRSIEAHGSNVEEAVSAGLTQLGLTRDQVNIEIVQEASRGVLGIGAKDAVVRLTEIAVATKAATPPTLPAAEVEAEVETDLEIKDEQDDELALDVLGEPLSEEQILSLSKDILAELLEKMSIQATIEARVAQPKFAGDSTTLVLDLQGKDLGFLIGRKGETLAAIQHLVRLIVNKQIKQRANLVVDVEGYKSRRETALKKLALRIADQVTRRNKRIALEPMNAYERRIIHITLRNHPTVITESVGERDRRKVTILPKPQ